MKGVKAMIIKNGMVFTEDGLFKKCDIKVSNGEILDIQDEIVLESDFKEAVLLAEGKYVIPGLIDVHFHGCMGHDFCEGTDESIDAITKFQVSKGVTSICPATMTLDEAVLSQICENAAKYNESHENSPLQGINLEGPFLSESKKGAQNGAFLHKPDAEMVKRLQEAANGLVKLVSIAPELEGAIDCIKSSEPGIKYSIAHTASDYATAKEAIDAGASHITHLYNAMYGLTHREPGVIGAAFDSPECEVELISDGVHIMPTVIRATFKLFGDDRVILISDSMMACGMPDGRYALGGQPVNVKGNLATLDDGTLAGSVTNLMDCMTNAVSFGVSLESAVKAATINPARSIGIDDKFGSISAGKTANLVILNKDLSINRIVYKGKILS